MNERRQTVTTPDDEQAVSRAVVETVADATSRDVTELPPLYDVLDPDALDALLAPRPAGDAEPLGLAFDYADCRVSVERTDDDAVSVTVAVDPE